MGWEGLLTVGQSYADGVRLSEQIKANKAQIEQQKQAAQRDREQSILERDKYNLNKDIYNQDVAEFGFQQKDKTAQALLGAADDAIAEADKINTDAKLYGGTERDARIQKAEDKKNQAMQYRRRAFEMYGVSPETAEENINLTRAALDANSYAKLAFNPEVTKAIDSKFGHLGGDKKVASLAMPQYIATILEAGEAVAPGTFQQEFPKIQEMSKRTVPAQKYSTPIVNFSLAKITKRYTDGLHQGLDVDGNRGDSIMAMSEGTVVATGENPRLGKFVVYEDTKGNRITYGHLDNIAPEAQEGMTVANGQVVGAMGVSGHVIPGAGGDGSHVHIIVARGGKKIDPLDYLSGAWAAKAGIAPASPEQAAQATTPQPVAPDSEMVTQSQIEQRDYSNIPDLFRVGIETADAEIASATAKVDEIKAPGGWLKSELDDAEKALADAQKRRDVVVKDIDISGRDSTQFATTQEFNNKKFDMTAANEAARIAIAWRNSDSQRMSALAAQQAAQKKLDETKNATVKDINSIRTKATNLAAASREDFKQAYVAISMGDASGKKIITEQEYNNKGNGVPYGVYLDGWKKRRENRGKTLPTKTEYMKDKISDLPYSKFIASVRKDGDELWKNKRGDGGLGEAYSYQKNGKVVVVLNKELFAPPSAPQKKAVAAPRIPFNKQKASGLPVTHGDSAPAITVPGNSSYPARKAPAALRGMQ